MDDFYQTLKKIQKYERSNGELSKIDETFYENLYNFLDELKQSSIIDPFAPQGVYKDIFYIGAEICQRREHKILDAAVVNMHRQYTIFLEKSKVDSVGEIPSNLTFSEKKLYFSLIELLKQYREDLILNNDDCSDLNISNFNIKLSSEYIEDMEDNTTEFSETNHENNSLVENMEKIANLYEKGFLTDDEFKLMKQNIFGK